MRIRKRRLAWVLSPAYRLLTAAAVRALLHTLRLPLALATAAVAIALVLQIMAGLNGVIPEHDAHEMARTAFALLLLDALVLAWMAYLRRSS